MNWTWPDVAALAVFCAFGVVLAWRTALNGLARGALARRHAELLADVRKVVEHARLVQGRDICASCWERLDKLSGDVIARLGRWVPR